MLKITFTIERRKPAQRAIQQPDQQEGRQRLLLPVLAFTYCAVLSTSLVTGDNSLLLDLTRGLVQFASRLLGFDPGT